MGDFNSQIGVKKTREAKIMDLYNFEKRNKIEEKIIELCQKNNLKIIGLNTLFNKKKNRQ